MIGKWSLCQPAYAGDIKFAKYKFKYLRKQWDRNDVHSGQKHVGGAGSDRLRISRGFIKF